MTATPNSSSLNAARRAADLEWLDGGQVVDLLVIGGGVTGAGVALDAAARGLSVVLAEKHDIAFGTSRWSSKLAHGGLRYLAHGQVAVAHESAVERGILMTRTAPHLVHALPQVLPLLPQHSAKQAALIRAGFLAGDVLRMGARTPSSVLHRPKRINAARVRECLPTVRSDGLRGGLLSFDGQLSDDVRLVVTIARTAAAHGARVLTRCSAEQVTGSGAVLHDLLGGHAIDVAARMVINAAGVWAGHIADGISLRPSRGTHLVLPRSVFGDLRVGMTVPVPGSGNRFAFVLPAPEHRVYLGITDEEAPGPIPDVPQPTDQEIDFLLDTVSTALEKPLHRSDMLGAFAGLRPLLDTGGERTADLSRKHAVITAPDGLVTVVGGKLTTYRRMAEDAVDAALAVAGLTAPPCGTRELPLLGAAGPQTLRAVPAPDRLVARYGTEAVAVLDEADDDPELRAPICDGVETTHAELRYAVRHEGALDVDDLLDRRCRVGLAPGDRMRALPAAAAALAGVQS